LSEFATAQSARTTEDRRLTTASLSFRSCGRRMSRRKSRGAEESLKVLTSTNLGFPPFVVQQGFVQTKQCPKKMVEVHVFVTWFRHDPISPRLATVTPSARYRADAPFVRHEQANVLEPDRRP